MSSITKCIESDKSEKCHIGKFTLFYDDFRCGFQPNSSKFDCNKSPYIFIPVGDNIVSNDGQIITQPECLTINSSPYMFTTSTTPNDHLKFYTILKTPFNAPAQGEIVFECIVSLLQTGIDKVPESIVGSQFTGVNNVNSDLRLASGKFSITDPDSLIDFGFLLTNEDIYINYYRSIEIERTPIGFIQTIPIQKRNSGDPLNDFVKLAIGYNKHNNYVRWLINDVEVYRINRLGFPLQRNTRIIEYNESGIVPNYNLVIPDRLTGGFGTVSYMDGYQPQNLGGISNAGLLDFNNSEVDPLVTAVNGSTVPATFMALYNSLGFNGSNFGQGAILRIKYMSIYLLAPQPKLGIFPNLYCCKQSLLLSRCQQNAISGVRSSDNLYQYQCRGYIDNDDECISCERHCDCLFEHEHSEHCMTQPNKRYLPTDYSESENREKIRKRLENLI